MTATKKRLLIWAIDIAISSEHSFIDCHKVSWRNGKKVVPAEHRPITNRAALTIKRLKELANEIAMEQIK